MKKWQMQMVISLGIIIALCASGCQSQTPSDKAPQAKSAVGDQMRVKYQNGQKDQIRFTRDQAYKSWVQMPSKEPGNPDQRVTNLELLLNTEVEKVNSDGSAIVKVTVKEAALKLATDVQGKKTENSYRSTAAGTESTWSGEPALAGLSYKIKIAPDTTVLEIMGLEEIRKQLNLKEDDISVATALLREQDIKQYHQRQFVMHSPEGVTTTYEKVVPIPDVMIKAQALKKTFKVNVEDHQARVSSTAEPLYVVPEGMEAPAEPTNFSQGMIKKLSDMQEMKVTGQGVLDLQQRKVTSEQNDVDVTLILLESAVGQVQDKTKAPGGELITSVVIKENYEIVK